MKKPYQLTPDQAAILRVMAAQPRLIKAEIMAASGVGKNPFNRAFDSLKHHQLVGDSAQRIEGTHWYLSCLTMAGRRALADFEAALRAEPPPPVVPPNRIDVMRMPVYRAAASRGYVRNDGHRHIASRGIAC